MSWQLDTTVNLGQIGTATVFIITAFVAIIKREQRTTGLFDRFEEMEKNTKEAFLRIESSRKDDQERLERRFESIGSTLVEQNKVLAKQGDALQKIVLYDYRMDEMSRRMDDVPIQVRALIGQYLAENLSKRPGESSHA